MPSANEKPFETYEEAVAWITGLIPFGIRPGLPRMQIMLERLDHPERRLKFIHVAGTNGKGSVCAYLTHVLRRAGYDVGTFTSPYIERFTSRIQYNLRDIPDDEVLRLANRLRPLYDELAASELGSPTMFEMSTLLALLYYATVSYPDYVVWETGLGGRLDATNVVVPVVSVITNIGHDHMDVLGDTLEKVAAEKAGIIKPGVPVVTAASQPGVLDVIRRTAAERHASLYARGEKFEFDVLSVRDGEQVIRFRCPFRELKEVAISMNGVHQTENAAVALMTLEVLRQFNACVVDDEDLFAGMRETSWRGRLETVRTTGPRIVLDGAHNPEGAEALGRTLSAVYQYRNLILVLGMLDSKNHSDYLRHILPLVNTLVVTEPDWRKKKSAVELAQIVRELNKETNTAMRMDVEPDWKKALKLAEQSAGEEDLIVVAGSLYLISDARSWIVNHTDSEKGW